MSTAELSPMESFVIAHNLSMTPTWVVSRPDADIVSMSGNHYACELRMGRRRLTVYYSMGFAHTQEPGICELLECLRMDAQTPESFDEFCSEYGYDNDSIKASKLHKHCLRLNDKLRRFMGEVAYEEFLSLEV